MSLVRSVSTIAGFTLISRVFGFVRDVLMASLVGASWLSDAFFVAFKLPNFMRRLFAEGAFNSAFVPLFSGMLVAEGKDPALRFAREVKSVLVLILLVVTVLAELFTPALVHLIAPGFLGSGEKFDLTVSLTRITFPYLFLISLVSLYGAMLNSLERFAAVAATPIIMNLCLIASMGFVYWGDGTNVSALAWGVLASGVAQLAWLMHFCKKVELLPGWAWPRFTEHVKKLLFLIGPAALGAGVAQINLLIDTIIATHIENGVSYLYYADRISELPLGVIGIAVGTALLPMLSKLLREGKKPEAMHRLNRAIELSMLLSFPAAAALMAISEPIIRVLYERGEFTAVDTLNTHTALVAFAAGLPAFVLIKVFAPVFFASHDTKTPVKIAAGCVLLNLILNLMLMGPFKHVGLAMATSIAAWVNIAFLATNLHRLDLFVPDALLRARLSKIFLSTGLMVMVVLLVQSELAGWFAEGGLLPLIALILLVTSGLATYGICCLLLKLVTREQLWGVLSKDS